MALLLGELWEEPVCILHSVFVLNSPHPRLAEAILYLRLALNSHIPEFSLTSPSKAWKSHPWNAYIT